MPAPAHDIHQGESRQIADAIDHVRQAVGILHELAAVDEDHLVLAIAASRVAAGELARLLKEAAVGKTSGPAAIWSATLESRIAAEQARLAAELDA